jgi:hypothetical protein
MGIHRTFHCQLSNAARVIKVAMCQNNDSEFTIAAENPAETLFMT